MRLLIIVSLLWAAPVLLGSVTQHAFIGSVFAAEKKREKRRVAPLKERTYRVISEAQVLIDPNSVPLEEGEERPDIAADPRAAVALLKKLLGRRGLNSYEIAQIWNSLAYAYYILEDTPNTLLSYENVLKLPQMQISLALEMSSVRALFQLYYADEEYRKAISYMTRWEGLNANPDANVAYIKATAYYQLEEFGQSLAEVKRVERITTSLAKKMKENWLYLYVVIYNELEDIDNVIVFLERLILAYPKKTYWMHLAGMYAEKEWEDKALSAYYAVYLQGMFKKETEIVMLSQRLLNAEVPFEAAAILEKGFKDGLVEENEKNIRLLASSYTMAQEFNQAIGAWRKATRFAEDGEIYYRLAQALASEDRHKEAVKAYRDAIKTGDLKNKVDVTFWLGISLMQVQDWNAATKAFREAAKTKKRAKSARSYIRYIASEKRRLAALKEMLEAD